MKTKAILWLLAVNIIYASSLVQMYKNKGIEAVELAIEKSLQDKKYWLKYLQDKNVSKGFYEFSTPIIWVDKTAKTMELFNYADGNLSQISSQNVITGKMGDKQKEGDLKTPVGVYDITRRFVPKDTFYGPISFALSYPNILDKLDNKNGHGIWIHGFPLDEKQREDMTKGCVALENELLVRFDKDLGGDKAVVLINESAKDDLKKAQIAKLLASLYKWREAWKQSRADEYLSFYDADFKRFDGKNKSQFSRMKKAIFSRKGKKIIRFTNIAISPYPNMKNIDIYRIVFDEYYKTNKYKFEGKKELYVKLENEQMKILVEK